MDANLKCSEVEDPYQYMGRYFDFLRDKIDRRSDTRNYYWNILKGLSLVRPKLFDSEEAGASPVKEQSFDFTGDEGHPVYLLICLFGPHDPNSSNSNPESSFLPPLNKPRDSPTGSHDLLLNTELEQPSVTEKLVKVISDQMLNFMIVTPCLDLVKKEKIVQFVQSAKRSLLVDLQAHKHKLKELLSDFIN